MEITCHILLRDTVANGLLSEEEVTRKQSEISKMRSILAASRYQVDAMTTTVLYRMKIQAIERELGAYNIAIQHLSNIQQLEVYRTCKEKQLDFTQTIYLNY